MINEEMLRRATMIADLRCNNEQKYTAIYLRISEEEFDEMSVYVKRITRKFDLENRVIYVDINYDKKAKDKRAINILKQDIEKGNIEQIFIRDELELNTIKSSIDDFLNLCEKHMVTINYVYK